jgi:hypothetical protein
MVIRRIELGFKWTNSIFVTPLMLLFKLQVQLQCKLKLQFKIQIQIS